MLALSDFEPIVGVIRVALPRRPLNELHDIISAGLQLGVCAADRDADARRAHAPAHARTPTHSRACVRVHARTRAHSTHA